MEEIGLALCIESDEVNQIGFLGKSSRGSPGERWEALQLKEMTEN